jgi:Tropinone reductase 1
MNNNLPRWNLEGRRALVTGGTKGIGWATAEELLTLGASVMIAARGEQEIAERLGTDQTGKLYGVAADVSTPDGRAVLMDHAASEMGGLDFLINNAGTNIRKSSLDYSPQEFAFLFDTNLVSAWELARLAHPLLKASAAVSGDAGIVNIGSVAGSVAVGSGAPYAMMHRNLRKECWKRRHWAELRSLRMFPV